MQNNGPMAHQEIMHVHFHLIPKPNETEGLGVKWPSKQLSKDRLEALAQEIRENL